MFKIKKFFDEPSDSRCRSKTVAGFYCDLHDDLGRRSNSESPPYSAGHADQFLYPTAKNPNPPPISISMPSSRRVSASVRRKQTLLGNGHSPLHVAALFASAAKAAIGASNSKLMKDKSVSRLFMTSDEVFKLWDENMRIRDEENARKQLTASRIRKIASIGAGDIPYRKRVAAHRAKSIDMQAGAAFKDDDGLPTATITAKEIVFSKISASSDTAVNMADPMQRRRSPSAHKLSSGSANAVKRRFSCALAVNDSNVVKKVVLEDHYVIHEVLGTGRFGTFKLAEHRDSHTKITLKCFHTSQTKLADFIREYNYSRFMAPHPNAVDTFEGVFQTADDSAFFFVQEYCPYGSLKEVVEKTNALGSTPGIGEKNTKTIMLKVLSALEFMHSEGLVHRNLKAENVLIFDLEQFTKVKITEFGLTRFAESNVKHLEPVNPYQATELCETVVNETLTLNKPTDIWSIGIIIAYCLRAKFPWQKATIMEWDQYMKHKTPQLSKFFEPLDEKAVKLFKHCLNPRPKDRWNVKDLKKYLEKEPLEKTSKVPAEDSLYYPTTDARPPNNGTPRAHRKSVIGQWLNTVSSTVSEISDQVVSARSEEFA